MSNPSPRRRRDRRGRGLRGPLAWPPVPAMATRAQEFDDLVLDSADRLESVISARGLRVDFAVEDVPPADPAPWEERGVPLGRAYPARGRGGSARVVVYRRPVESRAVESRDLALIVHEVVVGQVAALLGRRADEIDPGLGR
ncbi:MAG: metallopeptidase family protein [Micrococcales bacterium]|nr:metallopeptidase family protein [Micrococcales bacterium]